MTELKTLEDLKIRRPKGIELPYLDWFKEKLRAEAVKWVKDCSCCKISKLVYIYYNDKLLRKEMQRDFCFGCMRFINFFNLTEEDLKETKKDERT